MKENKDSPNSTFDPEELLTRVENDRELLQDLLTIFKEEFPGHLQALREAVESGEGKCVVAAAHALKGMLSNLAATQAAAAAAKLEQLGRNGEVSQFQEAFALVETNALRLLPKLEAYIAEVHK